MHQTMGKNPVKRGVYQANSGDREVTLCRFLRNVCYHLREPPESTQLQCKLETTITE